MTTLLTTVFLMFLIAQLMRNTMTFALVCVGQKRSPRKNPTERFENKILLHLSPQCEFEQAKVVETTLYFRKDGTGASTEAPRGERVGYLTGYLLPRPSNEFSEMVDAISAELHGLAEMLCESDGSATKIETGLSGPDVSSGGFFHIYKVEIGKGHLQGRDRQGPSRQVRLGTKGWYTRLGISERT
jgi:hypothetical protein